MVRIRPIAGIPRQLWRYARRRRVSWYEGGRVGACGYPRDEKALRELADHGVTVLINLHERPHTHGVLARYGLSEIHLQVPDFTPPTRAQLEQGVAAIDEAVSSGLRVAGHCGAGIGRTRTPLACYLVRRGLRPEEAIARVRAARPGSVETPQQEAAVAEYARQNHGTVERTDDRLSIASCFAFTWPLDWGYREKCDSAERTGDQWRTKSFWGIGGGFRRRSISSEKNRS